MNASWKARGTVKVWISLLLLTAAASAEKKEFKYTAAPGSTVAIFNQRGSISVKPSSGRQVVVIANPTSDKVEIDGSQSGNRITLRTHLISKVSGDEAKVDYEVQIPADAGITIDSGSGDVRIENVRGGVSVDSEEGTVEVRGVNGGFIQVQSVNGPIVLGNVQKARVQLTSTGGNIRMDGVSGPSVAAKSTTGSISFAGDCNGGGTYLLTNHSGDIELMMPASASVDLTARSIKGSVENDFPLQKPAHAAFAEKEGKTLAGTANSASSSVELRSFSGKIRVKKQ
jgi:DUF4097 and DUF4098 domain-containing protein YvlB